MPTNSKPCHNCRRRRLRCDRSWPSCNKCIISGQECLGYGKVFVWTQAMDSEGNMKPSSSTRRTLADQYHGVAGHKRLVLHGGPPLQTAHASRPPPPLPCHTHDAAARKHTRAQSDKAADTLSAATPQGTPPSSQTHQSPSLAGHLTDPVFQDLDQNSRRYLAHCKSLTPRRLQIRSPARSLPVARDRTD
jgi:hypothetical protein